MQVFEGQLVGQGLRIGIVVARFNGAITQQLLEGALDCLRRHGVSCKIGRARRGAPPRR
mgnify:CR=1 FL=1